MSSFTDSSTSPRPSANKSHSFASAMGKSELRRMASRRGLTTEATKAGTVPSQKEKQVSGKHHSNDGDDEDTTSNYGDEDGEAHTASDPSDQNPPPGVCSPSSYAEFTQNPYLSAEFGDNESQPSSQRKSDRNQLPFLEKRKRFVIPPTENVDEAKAALRSRINEGYNTIKAEELASLEYLKKHCT